MKRDLLSSTYKWQIITNKNNYDNVKVIIHRNKDGGVHYIAFLNVYHQKFYVLDLYFLASLHLEKSRRCLIKCLSHALVEMTSSQVYDSDLSLVLLSD